MEPITRENKRFRMDSRPQPPSQKPQKQPRTRHRTRCSSSMVQHAFRPSPPRRMHARCDPHFEPDFGVTREVCNGKQNKTSTIRFLIPPLGPVWFPSPSESVERLGSNPPRWHLDETSGTNRSLTRELGTRIHLDGIVNMPPPFGEKKKSAP